MNDVFATKVQPEEIPKREARTLIDKPIREPADINKESVPISLYEQRFDKPYAAEFFGLDNNLFFQLDRSSVQKLSTIESYILEQLDLMNYDDNKENYDKVLNNFLKTLGIDKSEKSKGKISKAYMAIILKKLAD